MKLVAPLNLDGSLIAPRDGFGEAMLELGAINKTVVALTADVGESVRLTGFAAAYPDRFFQVGVAEQNLAGVAAGLAIMGKKPFMVAYAAFSPGRNWDQIRASIALANLPVVICGSHAGLSVGPDGATHQALEDIALMRVLPSMTVVVPADAFQVKQAVKALADLKGPSYLRFGREKAPVIFNDELPFEIGQAQRLTIGRDLTLIATGSTVALAVQAADRLKERYSIEVINLHTVKPLDELTIISSVKKTGRAVTLEEHQISGGLGSAVAEVLSQRCPVPILRLGIEDRFGQSGTAEELYHHYGLDIESIVERIKNWLD